MLCILRTRPVALSSARCITGSSVSCNTGNTRNYINWTTGKDYHYPRYRMEAGVLNATRYGWKWNGVQIGRRYSGGPLGPKPEWPLWLKPALYAAGGVVLVSISWPLLRFVLLGGIGYGIYRMIRMALMFRDLRRSVGDSQMLWERLQQMASGSSTANDRASIVAPGVLETMQRSAEDGIRASFGTNLRVQQIIGGITAEAVTLGEAVSVEKEEDEVIGQNRVEAVFPVFVDGRGTAVFVQAAGALGSRSIDYAIRLDTLHVLARQKSGEVMAITIDPAASPAAATGQKKRRHVEDADYRDL
ncbi:hypothetical protein COEREDRAFT_80553 [Coemansia reversa NRRL 1564]|uniref:Uncharacterized protein n=1 Tax=Coemansia reversa (strain ATCC 12441 / NRRL 1564) TaxID=763665 RepID=A0A2G5BDT4_COERN|nr:hypothetical protein COEREDRAFT_80553 [Coemansia reversa NRRL 1564]|eukprot:PIA17180.1 hypothetical protein COEREDRAFT_80553 [Coemansia reversa NRRL 1564]